MYSSSSLSHPPASCGDARAAFVLQFVCVKTANQLWNAITGVACVGACNLKRIGGIFSEDCFYYCSYKK